MKTKKILLAALIACFTLTGCDKLMSNGKDNEVPKEEAPVTENATDDKNAENKDENQKDENSEENTENNDSQTADTENTDEKAGENANSDADPKASLEQAIFDNRTKARAIELLLDMAPEQVANIKPQLEEMLDNSNSLLEEAQKALDELNSQQ